MRLFVFHPRVYPIGCNDCKRWVYDLETGEQQTIRGPDGKQHPWERPPGAPLPCENCPKGGPENDEVCRLKPRHWQTLAIYEAAQATGGACLTAAERRDPILRRNLAVIHKVFQSYERQRQANTLIQILKASHG